MKATNFQHLTFAMRVIEKQKKKNRKTCILKSTIITCIKANQRIPVSQQEKVKLQIKQMNNQPSSLIVFRFGSQVPGSDDKSEQDAMRQLQWLVWQIVVKKLIENACFQRNEVFQFGCCFRIGFRAFVVWNMTACKDRELSQIKISLRCILKIGKLFLIKSKELCKYFIMFFTMYSKKSLFSFFKTHLLFQVLTQMREAFCSKFSSKKLRSKSINNYRLEWQLWVFEIKVFPIKQRLQDKQTGSTTFGTILHLICISIQVC